MVAYQDYSFKAMGSNISIQADLKLEHALKVFTEVEEIFKKYEFIASRFLEDNPLHHLNNRLNGWVEAPEELIEMIKEAYESYLMTEGRFDPRILKALSHAGYVHTFNNNTWKETKTKPYLITEEWKPLFEDDKVFIGNMPIDLGGIGKSFTALRASKIVAKYSKNFFVNAGGDVVFAGLSPEGTEWRISVENPYDVTAYTPAVLKVTDACVATSSIAKRSWVTEDNRRMHHIINPRTGMPSDSKVVAVTVIHPDAVLAEIWSKTLFLEEEDNIAAFTESIGVPVLWFTDDNKMMYNELMKPYVIWTI